MAKNPKMVYCRNCNTPMAENTVICPTCGAKNKKPIYTKWWFILLAVIVIFSLIRAIGGGSDKLDSTPEAKVEAPVVTAPTQAPTRIEVAVPTMVVEPTRSALQKYAVGEIVKIDDVQIIFNEVKEVPGTEYFKPEEGNRFISVDLTLENLGSDDFTVSSIMLFTLKDDTGQEYSISISGIAASGGKSLDGTIIPGDKLRGQLVYEIPVNASGLVLIFEPNILGSSSVRFDLGF